MGMCKKSSRWAHNAHDDLQDGADGGGAHDANGHVLCRVFCLHLFITSISAQTPARSASITSLATSTCEQ